MSAHDDCLAIVGAIRSFEGALIGCESVARLTHLTTRRVQALMPEATALAARRYPGETLKIHRGRRYRISSEADHDALASTVARGRKAHTALLRCAEETRMSDPVSIALHALYSTAATMVAPDHMNRILAAIPEPVELEAR